MRLKHLESALCSVPTQRFPTPNITLEQYATSPLLTAHVIITALNNDDLGPGRSALDLGCGTGMLMIGSALVGSDSVIAFDCDESALNIARENAEAMELEDNDEDEEESGCKIEFILGKVHHHCREVVSKELSGNNGRSRGRNGPSSLSGRGRRKGSGKNKPRGRINDHCDNDHDDDVTDVDAREQSTLTSPDTNPSIIAIHDDRIPLQSKCVDTVLTNPPFGTKHNAGIDMTFLKAATRLARKSVYSFHKSSTRPYLLKTVQQWGFEIQVVAQMKFDIPNSYKFHNKKSVDVEVDLIRVTFPTTSPIT